MQDTDKPRIFAQPETCKLAIEAIENTPYPGQCWSRGGNNTVTNRSTWLDHSARLVATIKRVGGL